MENETEVTIEDQFVSFAKLFDKNRSGETITLYRSDYWMRQARILDDRNVTMVDTGNMFFSKFSKTEITFQEWSEFVSDLCVLKDLDENDINTRLTLCGLPGESPVVVPEYRKYFDAWQSKNELYCKPVYDGFLCWPPTLKGLFTAQNCPESHFSNPEHFAFRRCGSDGKWVGRLQNETSPQGWTNYTPCFPPVVQNLFNKLHEDGAQYKFVIADITRTIEIVGFTLSIILLIISLIILHKFKTLHTLRTSIHKNLFSAMSSQVVVRLILYVDQAWMRRGAGSATYTGISAIENIPRLCIFMYILLEYFITVMFMWMLCEGMYLNAIVTSNVLRDNNKSYKYFCVLGWLLPLFMTAAWSVVTGVNYAKDSSSLGCWYGYNFQLNYWAMQGPRLAVILINLVFLLNIMRVLVLKLREDTTSDIVKTRKAVKAAMVLLPLLGITNILGMFEGPVSGPVWHFATWAYTTHLLRSFQGAVLAWIYCLGTAEVRIVVGKAMSNRLAIFRYRHPHLTRCLGLQRRRPIQRFPRLGGSEDLPGPMLSGDIPMRSMRYAQSLPAPTPYNISDIEQREVTVDIQPGDIPMRYTLSLQPNPQNVLETEPSEVTDDSMPPEGVPTRLRRYTQPLKSAADSQNVSESEQREVTVEMHQPVVHFNENAVTIEIPLENESARTWKRTT